MPKAASSSARPALRRNQACLSCRKRKLKCDAARPHCGTCVKQWQATISVPPPVGYAHPTEPQCSYDPVEGLSISPEVDPAERIRVLEEQISQLKSQLIQSRSFRPASDSSSPAGNRSTNLRPSRALSVSNALSPGPSPSESRISPAHRVLDYSSGLSSSSPSSQTRTSSGSPEMRQSGGHRDPMADLLYSGWDPDLPPPDVLTHYVDIFFRCDPCGSRMLNRSAILNALQLHPRDPGFPHRAVLHAICASASRWASTDVVILADGTRRDRFAERHVSKTREYIDRTMSSGDDIFPVMQACILLSWYFYQEGRWVEVWIFAGFQSRVAVPLRLNYPGTFLAHETAPGAYLPPPRDFRELESRRRTWWMTVMFDRIVSVGGWLHSIDERDIGTEFPVTMLDFEGDTGVASNPQDLAAKDVFTRHDAPYTDPFMLFLKAVMLFGRVTDYNTRTSLRAPAPPLRTENPFTIPAFRELDLLVCEQFLESFPHQFRKQVWIKEDGSLETDLYMAHIVPHAAAITLHNPYLNFHDPQSGSTVRCINATRSILKALHRLSETSLDTSRLHPFITICWYLAAVVQIQLCKYFIEKGDHAQEHTTWGEINALRFAMLTYGARSPIGIRQEKLLQGLMTEIVRMTSQMQPFEVGVPLYPFSHAGLFSKTAAAAETEPVAAPLPGSAQSFEGHAPPAAVSPPAPAWPLRAHHLAPPQMLPRGAPMSVGAYDARF